MIPKIILDRTTNKGFRYQLQQFDDRFVIFKLDTNIILSQQLSEVEWENLEDFSNEGRATKTFENHIIKDNPR